MSSEDLKSSIFSRKLSYTGFVLSFSFIFCLLFMRHYFDYSWYGGCLALAFKWLCFASICWIILLNRWIRPIVVILLIIPSAIVAYYEEKYKVHIDSNAVGFLFETNIVEAREFINIGLLFYFFIVLVFASLSLMIGRRLGPGPRIRGRRGLVAGAILLSVFGSYSLVCSSEPLRKYHEEIRNGISFKRTVPLSPLDSLKGYLQGLHDMATRPDVEDVAGFPSKDEDDEDKIIVLIIGESVRADHFQLNGYKRNTNPRLAKEENLVNFPSCLSYYCSTRWSVPGMLTPSNLDDPKNIRRGTFLDLLRKHGYYDVFASLNQKYKNNDINTTRLMKKVTEAIYRESLHVDYKYANDEVLLPEIRRIIDRKERKKVLAMHTRGNHFGYQWRYPAEYKVFVPDNHDACESGSPEYNKAILNAYDNAILYTDNILCSVIDLLRGRNAVLIYSSDHGESLGEGGRYFHGRCDVRAERHVPFFVWFSDEYVRRHPDRVRAARGNSVKNISHDHIFHTVLGLAGMESSIKRPEMDLTKPTIQEAVLFWKQDAAARKAPVSAPRRPKS